MKQKTFFLNYGFDKGKLKPLISWFFRTYGEPETFQFLEKIKNLGFKHATHAGSSISLDDLVTPPNKIRLVSDAELQIKIIDNQYKRGLITAMEKFQQTITIWQEMNETMKEEVIHHFSSTNILNPVYMMAFSGARGNMSQVRQLVGMRGLMADPQGQLIDFPIRSNFREGLTLTEYVISCYGARKGLVDTALRTAKSGYLTRRLVDVSQHITISSWDCGTTQGIFLTNLEDEKSNKIISSLEHRLVGRILHETIKNFGNINKKKVLFKNEQISIPLAALLVKKKEQVLVRSPLTCQYTQSVCQLCYGWGLSSANLVSLGEAVGVISGQSIGEPGTQLTMRTFHTGGVFYGELVELLRATQEGIIHYLKPLPGSMIRTPKGKIAFLTKATGKVYLQSSLVSNQTKTTTFFLPSTTLLFVKEGEKVKKGQPIAEFSKNQFQTNVEEKDFLNSEMDGKIFIPQGSGRYIKKIQIHQNEKDDDFQLKKKKKKFFDDEFQLPTLEEQAERSLKSLSFWILFGKIFQNTSFLFQSLINFGDLVDTSTIVWSFLNFTPYSNESLAVTRQFKKINFSNYQNLYQNSQCNDQKMLHQENLFFFRPNLKYFERNKKKIFQKKILSFEESNLLKNKKRFQSFPFQQQKSFSNSELLTQKKKKSKLEKNSKTFSSKNYTFDLSLKNKIFTFFFNNFQYYKFGYFFKLPQSKNNLNEIEKISLKNSISQNFFFSSDLLKFLFLQMTDQTSQMKKGSLLWHDKFFLSLQKKKGNVFFFANDWYRKQTQFSNVLKKKTLKKQKKKKNLFEKNTVYLYSLNTKFSTQGDSFLVSSDENVFASQVIFQKQNQKFSNVFFHPKKTLKKKKSNFFFTFFTKKNTKKTKSHQFFLLPYLKKKFKNSKTSIQPLSTFKSGKISNIFLKNLFLLNTFFSDRPSQIFFKQKSLFLKSPLLNSKLFFFLEYFFYRLSRFKKNKKKIFHNTIENFFQGKQKKGLKDSNLRTVKNFSKFLFFDEKPLFFSLCPSKTMFSNTFFSFSIKNKTSIRKESFQIFQKLREQKNVLKKKKSLQTFSMWYKGFSFFPQKNDGVKTDFFNNLFLKKTGYNKFYLRDSGKRWSQSGFLSGNIVTNPFLLTTDSFNFTGIPLVPPFSKYTLANEIQSDFFYFVTSRNSSFLEKSLKQNFVTQIEKQKKNTRTVLQSYFLLFYVPALMQTLEQKQKITYSTISPFLLITRKKSSASFTFPFSSDTKISNKKNQIQSKKYSCIAEKKNFLKKEICFQQIQKKDFQFFFKFFWMSKIQYSTSCKNFQKLFFYFNLAKKKKSLKNFPKPFSNLIKRNCIHLWLTCKKKNKKIRKNKTVRDFNFLLSIENKKLTNLVKKKRRVWCKNEHFFKILQTSYKRKKTEKLKQTIQKTWSSSLFWFPVDTIHSLYFSKLVSFQFALEVNQSKKLKKTCFYSSYWIQKQILDSLTYTKKKQNNFFYKTKKKNFTPIVFQQIFQKFLVSNYRKPDYFLYSLLNFNDAVEKENLEEIFVWESVRKKTFCNSFTPTKNKKLQKFQNWYMMEYLPHFFKKRKKEKNIVPFVEKTQNVSFSTICLKSGWFFFPKQGKQVIQNHQRFFRYGKKVFENIIFDSHCILLEVLSLKNADLFVAQKTQIQTSFNLHFFVKKGFFGSFSLVNQKFFNISKNTQRERYTDFRKKLNRLHVLKKKSVKISLLLLLRQTFFRQKKILKQYSEKPFFSSFVTTTEPLTIQIISNSKFRWKPKYYHKKFKQLFVFSTLNLKPSSFFVSEKKKKCNLQLSRIQVISFCNLNFSVLDSLQNPIQNLTPVNQIFWFIGKFSKNSKIILFQKPVDEWFTKGIFLQNQLSSFLQKIRLCRSKQYLSPVEQQIKPVNFDRLHVHFKTKISETRINKGKKLEISTFGQDVKNTTIHPSYKPFSIDVRVKTIFNYKKNLKKDLIFKEFYTHIKKKPIFRCFAVLLIPKGFVFETSSLLCQLNYGLVYHDDKNIFKNQKNFSFDNFFNPASFLKEDTKQKNFFSLQKYFLRLQYSKKPVFFSNLKAKNTQFFDFEKNQSKGNRQLLGIPSFSLVTYHNTTSFQQNQKKVSKTFLCNFSFSSSNPFLVTSGFNPYEGEIFSTRHKSNNFFNLLTTTTENFKQKKNSFGKKNPNLEQFLMLTGAEQISLLLETNHPVVKLGDLVLHGYKVTPQSAFKEGGQIIEIDFEKIILRRGQNLKNNSQSSLFITPEETISQGWPIMTFSYQRSKTEDIVQGIPKIEQFFESRSLTEKTFLSVEIEKIAEENQKQYPNEQAILKSYERIQLMIVENIQRIYLSQGVAISDKHIEIVVKQMTSSVLMYDENDDAGQLFPFISNFSQIRREAKSLGPTIDRTQARQQFLTRVFKNYHFDARGENIFNEIPTSENTIIDLNQIEIEKTKKNLQITHQIPLMGLPILVLSSLSIFFNKNSTPFKKKNLSTITFFGTKKLFFFTTKNLKKLNQKEHLKNLTYFRKIQTYTVSSTIHSAFFKNELKNEHFFLKTGPLFPFFGTTKKKIKARSYLTSFYNDRTIFPLQSFFSIEKKTFKKRSSKNKKPKWVYLPLLTGITQAALTSTSFLSAASFQQTTLVLSRSAGIGRVDFLRGIKERVIVGERLFAGTGHPLASLLNFSLSREIKIFFPTMRNKKELHLRFLTTNKDFLITSQKLFFTTTEKKKGQFEKSFFNCYNFRKIKNLIPKILEKKRKKNNPSPQTILSKKSNFKKIDIEKTLDPFLKNWLQTFTLTNQNALLTKKLQPFSKKKVSKIEEKKKN